MKANTIEIIMERINNLPFNSKGCQEWQMCINSDGYGEVRLNNKLIKVHRFVYEQLKGEIPDGLCVLHSCDNPKCCNIEHLSLGTHQDNMTEKVARNRQSRISQPGELHGNHKLSEIDVLEIRALYKTGEFTQKDIGETFGVKHNTISYIVNNQNWSHL